MGTPILRRYVVLGPLGSGGVCEVYQTLDVTNGRPSALKMLSPALADDARAREMLHREALITDRLRHPSIPRVYDFGDAPLPGGRVVPFMALELLTGVVLAGRLARGCLPWREALAVAATVADALAVVHRRGVVHRDVHPMNIMLTPEGVKIIDFGLASADSGQPRLPGMVARMRKPSRTGEAGVGDPADDVYALGVLLYEMLTGQSPYSRTTPSQSDPRHPAHRVATTRLPRMAPTPVLLVPGLPRAAAELCRRCMAKRRADRPDSATVALTLWSLLIGIRPRPGLTA
jgi:serine/threonine-protein kinase